MSDNGNGVPYEVATGGVGGKRILGVKRSTFLSVLSLCVILVVVTVFFGNYLNGGSKAKAEPPVQSEYGQSVESTTSSYDYTLRPLPHKGGVIIDGGFPKGSTEAEKKEIVAKAAARDPFVLWYFLTRIYELEDTPSQKKLEDQTLRIDWHEKLLVLLAASDFKAVKLEGKTFFNEGVNSARQVTATQTTFQGDVPGTEVSMAGAKKKTVKDSCVNKQCKSRPPGAHIIPPKKKGPDTTNGAARQHLRDENAVTKPTKGYTGRGDEVAKEQRDTAGSTEHNDVGHAGSGAGGVTPPGTNSSGESNSGGGPAETALPGGVATPAEGTPEKPR